MKIFFVLRFLTQREWFMKFIRFVCLLLLYVPCVAFGAVSDFQNAAHLLSAARRGDVQTVQILINNGANVNYVDSTGLSLVCTAVMNNDTRAIHILQMYGADASNCDRQIKQYKQATTRAVRGEQYGFFSGLGTAQTLALSAVGVAAVVGGIMLLTDVFDSDSGGGSGGMSGDTSHGSGQGGGGSSGGGATTQMLALNLPYGPACKNGVCPPDDFSLWETGDTIQKEDFEFMSENGFNYLMVARAYNPFVRGYNGMDTIRIKNTHVPVNLNNLPFISSVPGGGKPINVAAITGTGVNTFNNSIMPGTITWLDKTQIENVQSVCNKFGSESTECSSAKADALNSSNKFYNLETGTENTAFDLTNSGSVFGAATSADTKLAQIIAGWEGEGRASGDYYGFIPNGQLTVYKIGAGNGVWQSPTTGAIVTGSYVMSDSSLAVDDTFDLYDETITVQSVDGDNFVATSGTKTYNGYILNDVLYIDSNADGVINQQYTMGGEGALTLVKVLNPDDYKNYAAIYNALKLQDVNKNYISNVVANLALPSASAELDYTRVEGAKAVYDNSVNDATKIASYVGLINNYYNVNTSDDSNVNTPGQDAQCAFGGCSNNYAAIVNNPVIIVNSAGHTKSSVGSGGDIVPFNATFENFAPVVFDNLKNLFMTVVAVQPAKGTSGETIDGYTASNVGTLELSEWTDPNDSSINYMSRICGLTGTGNGGAMNPWCFAAPGVTDLDAAAAMAGSVALVQSAFDYMTPQQIFLLLALTADGPYLGTNPATGFGWVNPTTDLRNYLQEMYTLPYGMDNSDAQYLESFKNAFGYGMINLERATRPNTNVYFYNSDTQTIVASNGNAYWRLASTTALHGSGALSLTGKAAIKTSFYDVLESADGTISLPRVWNANLTLDNASKHNLYMGDVLSDFSVDTTNKRENKIGNFEFSMSLSSRTYNDNLNGLDDLRVAFVDDDFNIVGEYQRFMTDGESRFNGRANGLLALASNTVSSSFDYKLGNYSFGARAFSGTITDENLLDKDPVVSSQFEPGRLGFVNGASFNSAYKTDKFNFDVSFGVMNESNTVLGMYGDGLLAMNGGETQYVDTVAVYMPFDDVKLSIRGTFANTNVDNFGGIISSVSNLKSNAFAMGLDVGGFGLTAAMPLAVVDGKVGYDYADFNVVENDGKYEIMMNNPHTEYIDMASHKREMRFSGNYKKSIGALTDAGIGFIYRVNPNNTDMFGNESIFMFKIHHRVGI